MYTGKLWLDFKNDEEEAQYLAEISRFTHCEDKLVIEFFGADEGHQFTGSCTLQKKGDCYTGSGNFTRSGEKPIPSTVSLKLEKNRTEIRLHGTWQDQGDAEPYQLEAELFEK